MTVSKAQKKAVQKYVAEKYDRIVLTIKKNSEYGKDQIQDAAAAAGMSVNAYINTAIAEKIDRDRTED